MIDNKEEKPYYIGHRDRLKTRYLEGGINALAEHEILELILFFSIPRIDTKPMAHRLLEQYKTLSNVLSAPVESLLGAGVSKSTAIQFKLFADVSTWITRQGLVSGKNLRYDEMGEYVVKELSNDTAEKVIGVLIDGKDNVVDVFTVCEGSFGTSEVNIRKLTEKCMLKHAVKLILAHNHPSGKLTPSVSDCVTTGEIEAFMSKLGIELVEHYIVAGNEYVGLKKLEEMTRLVEIQN